MKKKIYTLLLTLLTVTTVSYAQEDIGVVLIFPIQSDCQMTTEQVQADIFNYGDDLTPGTFDVRYQVDNGPIRTQPQIIANFNTNETRTVTFAQDADFSTPGVHVLKVWTDLGSDNDRTNDTLSITVENFPPTVAGTLAHDTTICTGQSDTLRLSGYTGSVNRWEFSNDNGATWISLSNAADSLIVNGITETRKYRVLVQSGTCPSEYSNEVTVTVVQGPQAGFVFEDKSACGSFVEDTLILKGFSGNIVTWESNTGTGWMNINHTDDTLIVNNVTQTTSYRAIVNNPTCPADTSLEATLSVIANTVGGDLEADANVCKGSNLDTMRLTGHIGDITWWERTTDNGINWNPVINQDSSQVYQNLTETTWFRVLVEADNCPSRYSDTVVITVLEAEVDVILASGELQFCDGDSATITADPTGFASYTWNTGATTPAITVNASGTYSVDVVDSIGCLDSDSITITVFDLPVAEAGDDQEISLGQTAQLMAEGGVNYEWSPVETLDNSNSQDPIADPSEDTQYTVLVTDANGCQDSDSMTVFVVRDFDFDPVNTITPNDDGVNDAFFVENIEAYPEAKLIIMNRYGDIVHEQTEYKNDWAGTSKGQKLPDGTYYYVITVPNEDVLFKGHINLFSK